MPARSFRRSLIPNMAVAAVLAGAVAVTVLADGSDPARLMAPPATVLPSVVAVPSAAARPVSAVPRPSPTVAPPVASPTAPHVPGEILIKFRPGALATERAGVRANLGASTRRRFRSGAEHWKLPPGLSTEKALERLARNPFVQYAEPNYIVQAERLPDDPRFAEQFALQNTGQTGGVPGADIDAPAAWSVGIGSRAVVVGIIDSGIDYTHPDLAANVYVNPGEIPGNGIDDEGNGFIDDLHGWDFVNDDADPYDDNGHGTHVGGIIGAVGDNDLGVVGVNWRVSLMALKFLRADGLGQTSDAIAALDYASFNGARVTNNSWGGGGQSQALQDAIAAAGSDGVLFVAAAGNNAFDNDRVPLYPSSYDLPNVIAVAATDDRDRLASYSNWGRTTVLLGAPGTAVLSSIPGGFYEPKSGTSMAAPFVTGAVALLESLEPGLEVDAIVQRLTDSVDRIPALEGLTVSGGRLNLFRLLAHADAAPPGVIDDLVVQETGSTTAVLRFTATGDDGEVGRAATYDIRFGRGTLDPGHLDEAQELVTRAVPGAAGSAESIEVSGLDPSTLYAFAVRARDEWGTPGAPGNVAFGTTLGPPALSLAPEAMEETLLVGQSALHVLRVANVAAGTLDWTLTALGLTAPAVPAPERAPGSATPVRGAAPFPNAPVQEDAIVLAPWLSATPTSGRVRAGETQEITLRFDASGLAGGRFGALALLTTNDAAHRQTDIPISLTVFDAPAIEVTPNAIAFGLVYTGNEMRQPLAIANTGTIPLNVRSVTIDHPAIGVFDGDQPPGSFVLGPGAARPLEVAWTPAIAGPIDASLVIESDAANGDGGTVSVHVSGTALVPPRAAVAPQTLAATLLAGTSTTRSLRVTNDGGSGLEVAFSVETGDPWLDVAPVVAVVPAGGSFDAEVSIDSAGQPAGVREGRVIVASNDPLLPRIVVPVVLDVADAPHLTYAFPPVFLESRALFAGLDAVTTHILEAPLPAAGPGTIEAIVEGDFGNPFERAAVTVEGTEVGSVGASAGGCVTATGSFAAAAPDLATWLADDRLDATIANTHAVDPVCTAARHTLRLTYDTLPGRLEYGALLPGETRRRTVTLANDGSRDLVVTRIAVTPTVPGSAGVASGDAATLEGPFIIARGATRPIDVPFGGPAAAAIGPGPVSAALLIESDDPGRPQITLPLGAVILPPPEIAVEPAAISATLLEGRAATESLRLVNLGTEAVEVGLAVEGVSGPAPSACPPRAIYVASYNAGTVQAFDLQAGSVSPLATGLYGPSALAVDPDGRLLHAAQYDGRLASIDLATGAVTHLDTGHSIGLGLAVSPADGTVFMTSYEEGSVLRIDPAEGSVTLAALGLEGPMGLAFDPSGSTLYVVESLRGTLTRVDLGSGTLTLVAAGLAGGRGLVLDPTGTEAWVGLEGRGSIVTVDLVTGAVRTLTSGLAVPREMVRDASTGLLLVSEAGADRLISIDPSTGGVVATFPGFPSPTGIAIREPGACMARFARPAVRHVKLPAAGSVDLDLRLDAAGLAVGTWTAAILAGPVRPFLALQRIPVVLAVAPRPRLVIEGQEVIRESVRTYTTAAASTTHVLSTPVSPGTDGILEVTIEGDYGSPSERTTINLEGTAIGTMGNVSNDCVASTSPFTIGQAQLLAAAADGTTTVTLQNTSDVAATCTVNRHRVRLRYSSADPARGVDLRDITLGSERTVTLVVRNGGGSLLEGGVDAAPLAPCTATPGTFSLGGGAAGILSVRCTPSAAGPFAATLRLTSNDPDRPVAEVALTGLGVEPARLVVESGAIDGEVAEARSTGRSLVVRNTGGRTLDVGAAVEGGAAFVTVSPPLVHAAPGQTATVAVTLKGLAAGTFATKVILTSNDPARPRVEIPVSLVVLPDRDRDGIADRDDICPAAPDADQKDTDADGLGDACDNCVREANAAQEDGDADGSGDACQTMLLLNGVREDGGERLEVTARAFDPQPLQPLMGEIRIETAPAGGPPAVVLRAPYTDRMPRLVPIESLVPGNPYRLFLHATDGETVPRSASAPFVHHGERLLVIDMPPRAAMSAPAAVACDRPLAGGVRLDATASADDDSLAATAGDIAAYAWYRRAASGDLTPIGSGAIIEAALPLGESQVVLKVTDLVGESAEATAGVVVRDVAPPALAISAEPAVLWPPNGALQRVQLRPVSSDVCDPSLSVILQSVATGGTPETDFRAPANGSCDWVELRAKRDGSNQRVYTVTCEARDRSGNATRATTTVMVPKSGGSR
jgi:subtilisin family serine protease